MIDVELIGAPAFSVAVVGGTFAYASINRRLSELIGVDSRNFIGQTPETLLSTDHAAVIVAHYRRCIEERRSVEFESFYDAPGGARWWRTTVSPVLDGEEGQIAQLIGVASDVTARKAAESRSREVDERIALAMDLLEGGFWHYSIGDDRFATSPQLSRFLAGAEEPLNAEAFMRLVPDEDRGALDIAPLLRGEADATTAEYRVRVGENELRWLSCRRRLTRDENGRPENVIGVVVDITDEKARRDVLAAEAVTDSLTDLSNRRGFEVQGGGLAARARGEGRGFGLLLLDLDRFKPVNDTHGHAVGDAVLREVAARLRRHVRPGDGAARLGGDEFALLVEDATEDGLAGLSRRLVDAMTRPVVTRVGPVCIGVSIGAALWGAADRDLASLADRADAALIAVKRGGRGAWRFAA